MPLELEVDLINNRSFSQKQTLFLKKAGKMFNFKLKMITLSRNRTKS